VAYPSMQLSQRLRPSADGRRSDDPILRDHASPFLAHTEG
jgi:hypothetical protein